MKKSGVVVFADGDVARIKVSRESACGDNCGACNMCGKASEITVKNCQQFQTGDFVTLKTPSGRVLTLAFLLYIMPIVLLVLSCAVAENLFGHNVSDLFAAITFFVCVFLCALLHKYLSRKNYFAARFIKTSGKDNI